MADNTLRHLVFACATLAACAASQSPQPPDDPSSPNARADRPADVDPIPDGGAGLLPPELATVAVGAEFPGTALPSLAPPEICDELDNDHDGSIDETVAIAFYPDGDGDGYGTADDVAYGCTPREGSVLFADDCDDASEVVHPASPEHWDGADNDCDGVVDEGIDPACWTNPENWRIVTTAGPGTMLRAVVANPVDGRVYVLMGDPQTIRRGNLYVLNEQSILELVGSYEVPSDQAAYTMTVGDDGTLWIGGFWVPYRNADGTNDYTVTRAFLLKRKLGEPIETVYTGGDENAYFYRIFVASSDVWIAGTSKPPGGAYTAVLWRLRDGQLAEVDRFGPDYSLGYGVTVDSAGTVYFVGLHQRQSPRAFLRTSVGGGPFTTVRSYRSEGQTTSERDQYAEAIIGPDGSLWIHHGHAPSISSMGRAWDLHVSDPANVSAFRSVVTLSESEYSIGHGDRLAFHPTGLLFVAGSYIRAGDSKRYSVVRAGTEAAGFQNSSEAIVDQQVGSSDPRTSRHDIAVDSRGRVFWAARTEETPGAPIIQLMQLDCTATSP